VAYSPPSGEYSVKVPEGWSRSEKPDEVTFTDKFNSVDVKLVRSAQAPTVDSAKTVEVPQIAAAANCFELAKVDTVTRKGGTAVHITYRVDGPVDPVTGKVVRDDVERYEFWKSGVEAVVTLSGSAGSDNVDPWKLVTDSFTWR
jgi:hypothetical protein